MTTHQHATWIKSTRSSGGGNCVEVCLDHPNQLIGVRDSKNPDGGMLTIPTQGWASFLAGVRTGKFDLS